MAEDMGIFRTDVEIESPKDRDKRRLIRAVLVDTGSEYSWMPAPDLDSLGVERVKRYRFRQADGSTIDRDLGYVILATQGFITIDQVVFGEPNDMTLLGAHTLEGMNVKVDVVRKVLVDAGPVPAAVAA